MKDPKKVAAGKLSKGQGMRFEVRVRKDLEKKYFVAKWTNQVEFMCSHKQKCCGRMHQAKSKFRYDPKLKRMMPIGMSSGFPDFICFRRVTDSNKLYQNIAVESKMDGKLDKLEKEKCRWLLDNHVFSKIWIAKKGPKRGEIVYEEFQ